MHRYKNVAITGAKGAGKSTLARWLLEQRMIPYAGFQTVRYDTTPVGPLYELRDILTGWGTPISELTDEGIRGIPSAFEGVGVLTLERAIGSAAPVLLLDEIGRFERSSDGFLRAVFAALDSEKTVIAVLKQEDLPYIQQIKVRADTLLIDLDQCGREQAREILGNWMENL